MIKIHLKIMGKDNVRQVKSSKERKSSAKIFQLNTNDKNYGTRQNRFLHNTLHLILFKKKIYKKNWIKLIVVKREHSSWLSENIIQKVWSSKKI